MPLDIYNRDLGEVTRFISQEYGLAVDMIKYIEAGVLNSNYLVSTSAGDYIFKIYNFKMQDQVNYEVEILEELLKNNYPCPKLSKAISGTQVVLYGDRPAVLYEYIEGEVRNELDRGTLFQVGQLEGRMHQLLQDFQPSVERATWDPKDLLKLVKDNREKIIESGLSGAKDLMAFVDQELPKYVFPDSLPMGITHQDIKPENIIISEGRVVGLVDFDNSYRGVLIHDITTTIIWSCFRNGDLDRKLLNSFLQGYNSVREMSNEEKDILVSAIKFRLVREAFIGPFVTMHRPKISKERSDYFIRLYKNMEGIDECLHY